jgi:uncharacterized phage protein gp47/JayE
LTLQAADREFSFFTRGQHRELILASWRNALRELLNPDTGVEFTESEIATATADGSRWWTEADAIDAVLMGEQQRALWLADQVRIDRASTSWLRGYHGAMWGESPLTGTGGYGTVTTTAQASTVWTGSTTIPDGTAIYGTDAAGLSYQVRATTVTPGNGVVELVVEGRDTGRQTNLVVGDVITWANPTPAMGATATVVEDFVGGTSDETDAEFARRLIARIRHKPAAGNQSHFRVWARAASNAVEDACVYSCAFHSGSVLVTPIQKRSGAAGPNARIAGLTVLEAVRSRLVPTLSPDVPARVHVVVVPAVAEPSDLLMNLSMARGSSNGWSDLTPWPGYTSAVSSVVSVADTTHFRMHSDTALPSGVTAPRLMRWVEATSRFESLSVSSVASAGGGNYDVVLSVASSVAVGDYISPDTSRRTLIAEAIESYFDERGPGEVVDLATDDRAHRAYRFPEPHEELPYRAGSTVTTRLGDVLGLALADSELISASVTTPTVPATPIEGPSQVTIGKVAVYAF